MIEEKEILKSYKYEDLTQECKDNLAILLDKVNKIRKAYAKPLTVTSGYRSEKDQIRIYEEKAQKAGKPFDIKKVPLKSKHLVCAAVDLYDPNKELQEWILRNIPLMEEIGVWFESFSATPNWTHVQVLPYGSWKPGKSIFFIP